MSSNTKPKTFKWYLCIGCKDILKKKKKKHPILHLNLLYTGQQDFLFIKLKLTFYPAE